jgi:hypothetical protein
MSRAAARIVDALLVAFALGVVVGLAVGVLWVPR